MDAITSTRGADAVAGKGELAGQVAFVTGGASGIGLATAQVLAARGASVAIFDLNLDRARAAVDGLRAAGGAAHAFAADIADAASVETAFTAALAQLARVDILVNNAGITRDGLLLRMSDEQWQQVMERLPQMFQWDNGQSEIRRAAGSTPSTSTSPASRLR